MLKADNLLIALASALLKKACSKILISMVYQKKLEVDWMEMMTDICCYHIVKAYLEILSEGHICCYYIVKAYLEVISGGYIYCYDISKAYLEVYMEDICCYYIVKAYLEVNCISVELSAIPPIAREPLMSACNQFVQQFFPFLQKYFFNFFFFSSVRKSLVFVWHFFNLIIQNLQIFIL